MILEFTQKYERGVDRNVKEGQEEDSSDDDDDNENKKWPMISEIKQIISLIKAVKQNYKFIDPMDNDKGIKDSSSFVTV